MEKVFSKYKDLFQKRYSKVSALDLGEDSIRYDFFLALQEQKQLEPWQIQLEYPIHSDSFVGTINAKRKRNEKPQVDLMVDEIKFKLSAEFGFFRRNSKPGSSIAKTENTYKMLNDFVRLGLHSYLTGSRAYFVCVADSKMLTHQLENKTIPAFPAKRYEFNYEQIIGIMDKNLSSKKMDDRFIQKLKQLELSIKAELIFNEEITSIINDLKTCILIWEINSFKSL